MVLTTLWIYIALLVLGGLIGFLKAKSRISLVSSAIFAVALALCATQVLPLAWSTWLLALLVVVFAMRAAKTKKFMPSGLMLVITVAALVSVHL